MEPHEIKLSTSESFASPPEDAVWEQINIGLVRTNADALTSARAMFRVISPHFERWQREGWLHWWFFMRKPPDVRLRILLKSNLSIARNVLDRELISLREQGDIRNHYWSRYAPEQQRFGGAATMTWVHSYFHIDSCLWLYLDHLEKRAMRRITADQLLPAALHHMFLHCCGPEGVADAWSSLARLIGDPSPIESPVSPLPPLDLDLLAGDHELHPDERLALALYADANQTLRDRLHALSEKTMPVSQIHRIVATIGLFNLNRHGFPGERSGPLIRGILASQGNPKLAETLKKNR